MEWHNEAPQWEARDAAITMRAAAKTDFWRQTH